MKLTPNSRALSFDIYILACDGEAYAVGDNTIKKAQFKDIIPFVRNEMVTVCHLEEISLIEIRDINCEVVNPFSLKGKFLMLTPFFFGKNYSLFVNGKHSLNLDIDYWCKESLCVETIIN